MRYIESTRSTVVTQKWQFIGENVRYVMSNILAVQKQSLRLRQITIRVHRQSL